MIFFSGNLCDQGIYDIFQRVFLRILIDSFQILQCDDAGIIIILFLFIFYGLNLYFFNV